MIEQTSARDIVVVGASAGGVEALSRFFGKLPANLPAAFFVVLHIPAHTASELDKVLGSVTSMPVRMPVNGGAFQAGTVYVASSDRHLMFDEKGLRVTRGPREGRVRPSVDVLFRSAAASFGSRVIGVVMTGTLDDGTAGLWAIKDRHGYAMVQTPAEAAFDSMPEAPSRMSRSTSSAT